MFSIHLLYREKPPYPPVIPVILITRGIYGQIAATAIFFSATIWDSPDRVGRWSLNRRIWISLLSLVCILAMAGTGFAHHGGAAFDMKSMVTVQGTITEFRWVNPHVQIYLDAADDKGNTVHWTCETADPSMLVRQGWSNDTLKPGDHVTLVGHPAKTGVKVMVLDKLVLANGQELAAKAVVN